MKIIIKAYLAIYFCLLAFQGYLELTKSDFTIVGWLYWLTLITMTIAIKHYKLKKESLFSVAFLLLIAAILLKFFLFDQQAETLTRVSIIFLSFGVIISVIDFVRRDNEKH